MNMLKAGVHVNNFYKFSYCLEEHTLHHHYKYDMVNVVYVNSCFLY
jgi:hypothetical protein